MSISGSISVLFVLILGLLESCGSISIMTADLSKTEEHHEFGPPDKSPCCWPSTMQARVLTQLPINGTSALLLDYSGMAIDTSNKRISVRQYSNGGKQISSTLIHDYKNHYQYLISGPNVCTKTKLSDTFPKLCINGSATLQLSSFLGVSKGKPLPVDFWSVGGVTPAAEIVVTSKKCAPVSYKYNMNGKFISLTFYNTTLAIRDQTYFDIPKSCNDAPPVSLKWNFRNNDLPFPIPL